MIGFGCDLQPTHLYASRCDPGSDGCVATSNDVFGTGSAIALALTVEHDRLRPSPRGHDCGGELVRDLTRTEERSIDTVPNIYSIGGRSFSIAAVSDAFFSSVFSEVPHESRRPGRTPLGLAVCSLVPEANLPLVRQAAVKAGWHVPEGALLHDLEAAICLAYSRAEWTRGWLEGSPRPGIALAVHAGLESEPAGFGFWEINAAKYEPQTALSLRRLCIAVSETYTMEALEAAIHQRASELNIGEAGCPLRLLVVLGDEAPAARAAIAKRLKAPCALVEDTDNVSLAAQGAAWLACRLTDETVPMFLDIVRGAWWGLQMDGKMVCPALRFEGSEDHSPWRILPPEHSGSTLEVVRHDRAADDHISTVGVVELPPSANRAPIACRMHAAAEGEDGPPLSMELQQLGVPASEIRAVTPV